MKPLVIYHANCADGFGAASLGKYGYTIEYQSGAIVWVGVGSGRRLRESLRLREKILGTPLVAKVWVANLSREHAIAFEKKFIAAYREEGHPLLNKAPYSSAMPGDANPMRRKEVAIKVSNAQTGERNSFFGKHHSEALRAKWATERIGANHPMFGKHHSEAARIKLATSAKQRVRKICPHCGTTAAPGNYAKYHGENCKHV